MALLRTPIERMYAICCERAGYRWAKIAVRHLHKDHKTNLEMTSDVDLKWFITQITRRHFGDERRDVHIATLTAGRWTSGSPVGSAMGNLT